MTDNSEHATLPPTPSKRVCLGPSDQYELIEPIGEGAMGMVWRARDTLLDIDVASVPNSDVQLLCLWRLPV